MLCERQVEITQQLYRVVHQVFCSKTCPSLPTAQQQQPNQLVYLQAFVRPTEHPQLDPFCIELTGIQQHQVDAAETLPVILQQHHNWLQEQGMFDPAVRFVPMTWTNWDLQVCRCIFDT